MRCRGLSLINNEWPDHEDRITLIREVDEYAKELHFLITAAYFEYPVQELNLPLVEGERGGGEISQRVSTCIKARRRGTGGMA